MKENSGFGLSKRLFKFHPERFYLLRDAVSWDAALGHLRACANDVQEGHRLMGVSEFMHHVALAENMAAVPTHEQGDFTMSRIANVFSEEFGEQANGLETLLASWQAEGKHLFDLSPISAMFAASTTKACHMPLAGLQFPFTDCYLHWGAHLKIPTGMPGRYIDGCYVRCEKNEEGGGRSFGFGFTSSFPSDDAWEERSLMGNVVMDAEGFFFCYSRDNGNSDETVNSFARGVMNCEGASRGVTQRWGNYVEAALAMAANCLYYLAWDGRDIEDTFDEKAPRRLVDQARSAKATEARRGASKLNALGFRVIKLCGRKLSQKIGMVSGSKEMPAHWRRGHLHIVRFGPRWSQKKVMWRDGLLVNKHKGEPTDRRLYLAEPVAA